MARELEPAADRRSALRVLVVDDDPQIRRLLCAHLSQRGHAAVGASTMEEALLVLSAATVDVLVTDVLLPDGDGLDLLNHVTSHDPRVRAVVVTGGGRYFGPEYFRRIGEALGATVLQKPFDRAAFLSAVESPCSSVSPPA